MPTATVQLVRATRVSAVGLLVILLALVLVIGGGGDLRPAAAEEANDGDDDDTEVDAETDGQTDVDGDGDAEGDADADADGAGDADGDTNADSDTQVLAEPDDGDETDDGDDQQPGAATVDAEVCEPHLATLTPEQAASDAIIIDAQAIDQDLGGWVRVQWQPAPGASITAVSVTDLDGVTTTHTSDIADGGFHTEVAQLRFCGSFDDQVEVEGHAVEDDEDPGEGTDGSDDEGADDTADSTSGSSGDTGSSSTETGASSGDTGGSSSGSTSTDSTSGDTSGTSEQAAETEDDDSDSDDDGEPANGVVQVETPDPEELGSADGAEDTDRGSATDLADTSSDAEDTEVLGMAFSRDDTSGGTSWLGVTLAVLLLAAVAAGATWWVRGTRGRGGPHGAS